MALIGKIREKSTLLLIVIGVGMLLFIAPYEQIVTLFGGGKQDTSIGMFFDEPIYSDQWNFEEQVRRLKFQYAQNNQQLPDDYARNAIFNQMINDTLLNTELRKIGITTTPDELSAIQQGTDGVAIAEYMKNLPYFQDQNKKFSEDSLKKKLPFFIGQEGGFWNQVEAELSRSNVISKYVSMVSKGIYVTDYEAERDYIASNETANLQYVFKDFATVPDSVIDITEEDYVAFYEAHKDEKKYEREETRGFDFVSINIIPSPSDSAFVKSQVENLKASFAEIDSDNDSLFVVNNSDVKVFNAQFRAANEFPLAVDTLVQKANVGDVIGPFQMGNSYQLVKVLESRIEPEAKVRHILCGFGNDQSDENKQKAKVRADSVLRVLRMKGNFDELLVVSDDLGKTQNSGEYGPFDKDASLVDPFKEFGLSNPVGTTGVVETNFGYHVMEVLERTEANKIVAPAIEKTIVPLDRTIGMYKDSAYRFIQAAKEAPDFDAYCKEKGFIFGVTAEEDIVISAANMKSPELENNSNILKWAFNADMGEVSDYFYLRNSHKIVVAKLTQDIPEGFPSLETAKVVMYDDIANEKKAEYLKSQVEGITDLNGVLLNWKADRVQTSSELRFNNKNLSDASKNDQTENALIVGTAFTLAPGVLSAPIAGKDGMYVMMVSSFTPVSEKKEDYNADRIVLQESMRARADAGIMKGLRDMADVKDYRKKRELIED